MARIPRWWSLFFEVLVIEKGQVVQIRLRRGVRPVFAMLLMMWVAWHRSRGAK
jgi:hypothetical protein